MNHRDKVAVITGASQGLGAGIARHFAALGIRLGLCARTLPQAPDGVDSLVRSLDMTDPVAVDAFAAAVEQHFGTIHLWINNAGVLEPIAPLRSIDPADFRRLIEINLLGVMHGSRAYVRHCRRRGNGGVLINISSGAARKAYAGWSAYCASKAAVDRFSEAVALEEAEQSLRVYAVAPGIVDTEMQERIRATPAERFPMVDKFHALKAEDRFNSPGFVAETLLGYAFDTDWAPSEVLVRVPEENP
ncbi:MAG: SDR family NAD(P)-dependent oxidoreductase [Candidatus Competibacterales bacterium]|nr:SDR family NAD(P)-dependent oxidoreductase [Candidatus Competibacterales bacterium]